MQEQASDVDENNNNISSSSSSPLSPAETQRLQGQCESDAGSKSKSIGLLPTKMLHENEITTSSKKNKNEKKQKKLPSAEIRNYLTLDTSATGSTGDSSETTDASTSECDSERIKHVRFGICVLALLGFALGVMSRLILNVAIVEMVRQKPLLVDGDSAEEDSTLISIDELGTPFPSINETVATESSLLLVDSSANSTLYSNSTVESAADANEEDLPDEDELAGLRFNWTKKEVNMVLGAFYVGYIPGILSAGSISNRYGAKYPLFVAVFGSAVINLLTPLLAQTHLYLLVGSRVLIGCIQGPCTPCLYDLFGKWLTATESSIFAPMIKVSMPMGALIGTLMPGILSTFGFKWPFLFFLGGSFCLFWSVLWLVVATSTPHANRFVGPTELSRITRKKAPILSFGRLQRQNIKQVEEQNGHCQKQSQEQLTGSNEQTQNSSSQQKQVEQQQIQSIPWLRILTNRSVLALTLVKFTYNACMDVIYLELAIYLREVHSASIETISAIASGTYCIQMIMITFVAWLAKNAVNRKLFGLSKTKWRKIFQGGSNFCMAAAYFALPLVDDNLEPAACLLLSAAFFWLLGAGGESMLPYDLSPRYTASIVSFAHSVSKFSGLTIPILSQLVLGEETDNASRWNLLFGLLAGAATIGGLVFVLVVRAKPFLAEEMNQQQVDRTRGRGSNPSRASEPRQCRSPSRLESIEED